MGMGYANMRVTFANEEVPLATIDAAMQRYGVPEALEYGRELAASVEQTLGSAPRIRVAAVARAAGRFLPNAAAMVFPFVRAGI
jgi:hypothetical protein